MAEKVLVAMSGGVDSSVAAALLKEQGFDVHGVFMKNWSPEDTQSLTDCPWEQDQADAEAVSIHLGIPFRSVNFEREYRERVVEYFLGEYSAGRTPNPDVMCNKEIKFGALFGLADEMGIKRVATGHYAQLNDGVLARGMDTGKDQSYFLYTLSEAQRARAKFPVGKLTKVEVRAKAAEFGLPTALKKDSQGICFIGHLDLKKFLEDELGDGTGSTWLLPPFNKGVSFADRCASAIKIGERRGTMYYTVGERAGNIVDNGLYRVARNTTDIPPLFIVAKTADRRTFVTENPHDPDTYTYEFVLERWLPEGEIPIIQSGDVCQIRYQQRGLSGIVSAVQEGSEVRVIVDQPLHAVAEGQSLVVYRDQRVIGGGVVCNIIRRS